MMHTALGVDTLRRLSLSLSLSLSLTHTHTHTHTGYRNRTTLRSWRYERSCSMLSGLLSLSTPSPNPYTSPPAPYTVNPQP
jgi:hypothetical protein